VLPNHQPIIGSVTRNGDGTHRARKAVHSPTHLRWHLLEASSSLLLRIDSRPSTERWDWPSTIQFVDGTYWSCILQLRYWLLNLSSQHASAMMCRKIWSQCKQLFSLCEQAVCLKKEYGVLSVNKVCQRKRQTAPLKQSEECWLHWVSEPVSSIPWQHWEMSWLMWKTLYRMRRGTVWCAGSPVVTTQPLMLVRLEEHWSTT